MTSLKTEKRGRTVPISQIGTIGVLGALNLGAWLLRCMAGLGRANPVPEESELL